MGKYEFEIKEGKGYVKEYYVNGNIIFEGEYLDGKRNGKGKEYDYCSSGIKILFEGEYLNGIKNGKGKEYDYCSGIKIFEGEYLNGIKNGKGKEYNKNNGKLLFEGDYLKGKKMEWNIKGVLW